MQTFLPFPDFHQSACVLDTKRLRKQIIEGLQIFRALHDPAYGWQSHPAVRMWSNCGGALLQYIFTLHHEYVVMRGHAAMRLNGPRWAELDLPSAPFPQALPSWALLLDLREKYNYAHYRPVPHWFGTPNFHRAHQSNLLRKFPEHYAPFFATDLPTTLPYIWPEYGRHTPKQLQLFAPA